MVMPKKVTGLAHTFGWLKLTPDETSNPRLDVWETPLGHRYACFKGVELTVTVVKVGNFTSPPILGDKQ